LSLSIIFLIYFLVVLLELVKLILCGNEVLDKQFLKVFGAIFRGISLFHFGRRSFGKLRLSICKARIVKGARWWINIPETRNISDHILELWWINMPNYWANKTHKKLIFFSNFFVQEHIFLLFLKSWFLSADLVS
jgi:hypothetical protein